MIQYIVNFILIKFTKIYCDDHVLPKSNKILHLILNIAWKQIAAYIYHMLLKSKQWLKLLFYLHFIYWYICSKVNSYVFFPFNLLFILLKSIQHNYKKILLSTTFDFDPNLRCVFSMELYFFISCILLLLKKYTYVFNA
jgi:hypothetical protein